MASTRWSMMLLAALVGAGAQGWSSPACAQQGASAEAKKQYRIGLDFLEDSAGAQYQEAYEAFHRAYEISPVPTILGKIALCARMLERDDEAIRSYEQYLAEATNMGAKEMEDVAKALESLQAGSAKLSLVVEPKDANVSVSDERVPKSGKPRLNRYEGKELAGGLLVRAGAHTIVLEAEGYEPMTLELDLKAGTEVVQRLSLRKVGEPAPTAPVEPEPAPAPTPEPEDEEDVAGDGSLGAGTITLLAATGALTAGAVVVGILALQAKADYETYGEGGSRVDAEDVRATGELLNGLTDGFIAGAGVAAILSAVFIGLDLSDDGGEATAIAPVVTPGFVGVGVHGRF